MKTLNKTFSGLMLLIVASCFGLLTACGEGFEASKMQGLTSEPDQAVEGDINATPPGVTPPEVDQSIYDSFANERNGLNRATVLTFVFDIKAFGLELVTTEHPGGASSNTSARSLLLTGCANHQRTEIFDSSIEYNALLNGDRIVAGNNGLYEVILECTIDNCDEMMAVIRRQGDDTTDAIAFIGLEKDGDNLVSGRTTTMSFISRRVQIDSEFTRPALEPMTYLMDHCAGGSSEQAADDGTVLNPLGNNPDTFFPPTQEFRWPDPVGQGDSL